MPAVGFTEPWSARAGDRVFLHLSCIDARPTVRVVRLDRPDRPPTDWPVERSADVGVRSLEQGSFVALPPVSGDVAVRLELRLTRNEGERTLVFGPGFTLLLGADGHPILAATGDPIVGSTPVPRETWCALSVARDGGAVRVSIGRLDADALVFDARAVATQGGNEWRIGAPRDDARPTLNARIGRITLEAEGTRRLYAFPSRGVPRFLAPVGEPDGPRLAIVNRPTFACTSARWDGSTFDPRVAPERYDAVHLHEDDTDALPWPATHAVATPVDARSGVYAFEVETVRGIERMPFFLRPARPSAPLAVLIPTATYLAYADERLPQALFPWACDDRGHRFAQDNGLLSAYDTHADGSGVSLVDVRRPRATLRDDYLYPLCGAPHLLPVDLRLLHFCAEQGIAVDLLTDHDLHAEGKAALAPYAGLVTGSHPEYWSIEMEDALRGFLGDGGNLAYLGGNGFDHVVAFEGGLMELRRTTTPSHRTWDMRPGEGHLALTGEPGGPLRMRGRGEHTLVGVGLTLMGFGPALPFTRTPRSREPDVAWLFEGVSGDTFGHEGVVLGGAAGYEVDCTNARLGTPPETIVVAVAEGFGEDFIGDAALWFEGGEAERAASRRAEMTLRTTEAGGIVFTASSVAWCGALPVDAPQTDVGRITRTLLERIARRP